MRKLRTIKPWNLHAVRLKAALTTVPVVAESIAQRGPGANGGVENVVLCRGAVRNVSLRAIVTVSRVNAPRGTMPVILRPR